MNIINLYYLLTPLIIYFIISEYHTYDKKWFAKQLLLLIAFIIFIINMFLNNYYINKYIFPLLLFLNIAILFFISFNHKFNFINYLVLLPILYLLYTFNYKDFELKNNCLLKNPNKKWIYSHIIILSIYYIFSNFIWSKFAFTLLVFYPLLFPINQYFIHRIFSLVFFFSFLYFIKI
jgi:hypothetical protein